MLSERILSKITLIWKKLFSKIVVTKGVREFCQRGGGGGGGVGGKILKGTNYSRAALVV